jgi:DNA-binding YbaB/EbfC family protein
MFKGISNFMSMMKQAKNLGGRLQGVSDELKGKRAIGSAGGGMGEIEVNGLGEVLACRIDPALFAQQDRELLEDFIVGACNQAAVKAKQLHAEAVQQITGDMHLPGLDEALAKIQGGGPIVPGDILPGDTEEDDEDEQRNA